MARGRSCREVVRHLVRARRRERPDIENPVQRLLLPQRMTMGQRVRLSPLPLREIRTQRALEVVRLACHATLTVSARVSLRRVLRLSHHGESAFAARRGSAASITRVDSKRLEKIVTQFIVHRRVSQVEQELVEQRGAGGIQRVIAGPLGQLFHQFQFGRIAHHLTQHR